MDADTIRGALAGRLSAEGAHWLDETCREVADEPAVLAAAFPAAGRRCGRGPLDAAGPELAGWTVDDAARTMLLLALTWLDVVGETTRMYYGGDPAEKRAVLRALPVLDVGEHGVPLVLDALRSNDIRLVAAAMGPYAADRLDLESWRRGVLKCVYCGVPLANVADLHAKADDRLGRMLADFAAERRAAGRSVPADVRLVLDRLDQETRCASSTRIST